MADQETWAQRVREWKASGLSSPKYCEGKPFTPGGLRHWAFRLGRGRQQTGPVRMARVVRLSEVEAPTVAERGPPSATSGAESEPAGQRPAASVRRPGRGGAHATADLVLEIGAARIAVRPGFDRATLAAVVEVLTGATGSGR